MTILQEVAEIIRVILLAHEGKTITPELAAERANNAAQALDRFEIKRRPPDGSGLGACPACGWSMERGRCTHCPGSALSPMDFELNTAWLRRESNRSRFAGKWVALRAGGLVSVDTNRALLEQQLRDMCKADGTLVVKVDL